MNIGTATKALQAMRMKVAPHDPRLCAAVDSVLDSLQRTPGGHPGYVMSEAYIKHVSQLLLECQAVCHAIGVDRPAPAPMSALQAARGEKPGEMVEEDPDEAMDHEQTGHEEPEPVPEPEQPEGGSGDAEAAPEAQPSETDPDEDDDEEAADEPLEDDGESDEPESDLKLRAEYFWETPSEETGVEQHLVVLDVQDLEHAKLTARATAEEWDTSVILQLVGEGWGDVHPRYRCSASSCRKIDTDSDSE